MTDETKRGFADPEVRARAAETRARKAEEKRQRSGKADKTPKRRLPISKVQVQHGVGAVIVGVDAALAYLVPNMWVTDTAFPENGDRLTDREVEILTEAFSDEAMKHPRVLRFLAQLTSVTDRMGIAGALLLVALPRLARRGMIPAGFVPVLRDLIGTATEKSFGDPPAPEPPPPVQNEETGPAREAA